MPRQMKQEGVDNAREVCYFIRIGKKNPKNELWNDEVKTALEQKEAAWKDVLGPRKGLRKKDV